MSELRIGFDDDALDRLAEAIATRIGRGEPAQSSPWLTAQRAADYLGCSLSRIRTLTVTGDLPCHRDGSRPLYHRDELDAYVRNGGAKAP